MPLPEAQYKVVIALPGGKEQTATYSHSQAELPPETGLRIRAGDRDVTVTFIEEPAIPGKKIGLLRAKLPST